MLFKRPLSSDPLVWTGGVLAALGFIAAARHSLLDGVFGAGMWWLVAGIVPAGIRRLRSRTSYEMNSSPQSSASDPGGAIASLAALWHKGLLSDEEFRRAKKYLSSDPPQDPDRSHPCSTHEEVPTGSPPDMLAFHVRDMLESGLDDVFGSSGSERAAARQEVVGRFWRQVEELACALDFRGQGLTFERELRARLGMAVQMTLFHVRTRSSEAYDILTSMSAKVTMALDCSGALQGVDEEAVLSQSLQVGRTTR